MSAEKLVTLEIAIDLREIGFDWPTIKHINILTGLYGYSVNSNDYIKCPTLSHAAQYFREVHNMDILPNYSHNHIAYAVTIVNHNFRIHKPGHITEYFAWEEFSDALIVGLKEAIQIVKEKTTTLVKPKSD